MKTKCRKLWNTAATLLVTAAVGIALTLTGGRLIGLQPFAVLSGSMEPEYPVGSLIYVQKTAPQEIQPGEVITFLLDKDSVATHRVTQVVTDSLRPDILLFRTKGDANASADAALVHMNNLIGRPVCTIPYLGYVISYVQSPVGRLVVVGAAVILLLLAFLPDLFAICKKKHPQEEGISVSTALEQEHADCSAQIG